MNASKHGFSGFIKREFKKGTIIFVEIILLTIISLAQELKGQEKNAYESQEKLLQEYVQSKGKNIIVFDASNIKQFWIDKSVVSRDDHFEVLVNNKEDNLFKSIPFKIQLANVIENQDCIIEIISDESDISFSVSDSKRKKLAISDKKNNFIHYSLFSGMFHLEDTDDFSFNIQFSSKNRKYVSVKKIVLSFSPNPESVFSGSPGYDSLMRQFEERGLAVPDSKVQYIFSADRKMIYFKVPKEMAVSYGYSYHVYPVSEDNLLKPNTKFNNLDFNPKYKKVMIPAPYSSDNQFAIIQVVLPPYPCSSINIGQYQGSNTFWKLKIKDIENNL